MVTSQKQKENIMVTVQAVYEKWHPCYNCDGCIDDNYCRCPEHERRIIPAHIDQKMVELLNILSEKFPNFAFSFETASLDNSYPDLPIARVRFGGLYGPERPDGNDSISGTALSIWLCRPFDGSESSIHVSHSGPTLIPRDELDEFVEEIRSLNPHPDMRGHNPR